MPLVLMGMFQLGLAGLTMAMRFEVQISGYCFTSIYNGCWVALLEWMNGDLALGKGKDPG